MSRGILYAVGVGPGDPELITLKAARVLNNAEVIFAASSTKNDYSLALSIVERHIRPDTPVIRLGFPMTRDERALEAAWRANAEAVLEGLSRCGSAAFITLGDPMTYSTFLYLWKTLQRFDARVRVEIIPGISSIHAAAAAAGVGLAESGQNLAVLSGVDDPARLRRAIEASDGVVILKAYKSFPVLRDMLEDMGLAEKTVMVSRCGLEGESIVRGLAGCPERPPYFSLLLVKK